MSKKPISLLSAVLLAVSALLAAGGPAAFAQEADISTGLELYQRYCQSCHNIDTRDSPSSSTTGRHRELRSR